MPGDRFRGGQHEVVGLQRLPQVFEARRRRPGFREKAARLVPAFTGQLGRGRRPAIDPVQQDPAGGLVEIAQQRILPVRPEVRVGRPHVGHRQQVQVVEPDPVADEVGEPADRRRVGGVLALGGHRHREMVAHQPPHQARVEAADPVPLTERGGVALAVLGVIRAAPLGDVVEQPRKMEQLRLRQGGEDVRAVRKLVTMVGPSEAAQVRHGAQQVLVHGIDVEEVELHEAGDPAELRQVAPEDPVGVHPPQRPGEAVRLAQDLQEQASAGEVAAELVVHQIQVAADLSDRRRAHAAQLRMLLKQQERLQQCERVAPEHVAVHRLELPPTGLEPPVEPPYPPLPLVPSFQKAFAEHLEQELVQPAHGLDGPVVAFHEPLDAEVVIPVAVAEVLRDRDLTFEQQPVFAPGRRGSEAPCAPATGAPGHRASRGTRPR